MDDRRFGDSLGTLSNLRENPLCEWMLKKEEGRRGTDPEQFADFLLKLNGVAEAMLVNPQIVGDMLMAARATDEVTKR